MTKRIAKHFLRILLSLLVGGLLAATLVRFAPGFEVDERELDTRLNQQSIVAIRSERVAEPRLAQFYLHYLSRLLHGDLGVSRSSNRPAASCSCGMSGRSSAEVESMTRGSPSPGSFSDAGIAGVEPVARMACSNSISTPAPPPVGFTRS